MKFSRTKLSSFAIAVSAIVVFASSAQARGNHYRYRAHYTARSYVYTQRQPAPQAFVFSAPQIFAYPQHGASQAQAQDLRRPAAWCGWQMRQLVSGDPGPSFNLARNWAHWGQPGPAGIGAVVVWSHHVGKIVGQQGGMWVIESGNDGHQLRTRPLSIAGAIAIRWG
jgi:hypothetical protein